MRLLVVLASCSEPVSYLSDEPSWISAALGTCWRDQIRAGDLDADGDLDIIVLSPDCQLEPGETGDFQLQVYLTTRSGLSNAPAATQPLTPSPKYDVWFTDLDADGRDDILLRSRRDVRVFISTGDPHEPLGNPQVLPYFDSLADLDRDGNIELLYWNAEAPGDTKTLEVIEVRDGTERDRIKTTLVGDSGRPIGDVDGDGNVDIAVDNAGQISIALGCGDCASRFGEALFDSPLQELPYPIGDWDADGRDDQLLFSAAGVSEVYLSGTDGGVIGPPVWHSENDPAHGPLGRPRLAGDMNHDGYEDVVANRGKQIFLFLGGERGVHTEPSWAWRIRQDSLLGKHDFLDVVQIGGLETGHKGVLARMHSAGKTYLAFYQDGRIGNAPPIDFRTSVECHLRDTQMADITVDRAVLRSTVRLTERQFPPDSCEMMEGCIGDSGLRRLLEFTVVVQNFGSGIAALPGPQLAPELYHYDACHGHNHLSEFAQYELQTETGEPTAFGHKQGYRFADTFNYCGGDKLEGDANTTWLSPGWADIYSAGIPCQWIDVTDLPDGDYNLRVSVNVGSLVEEDDVRPNTVEVPVRLEGKTVTALP